MCLFTHRPGILHAFLAGASLVVLAQAASSTASAQDATPPRTRANALGGQTAQSSVQLEELSVTGPSGGRTVAGPVLEDPRGPVTGFVAKRSLTATKTDTPLIETPQSITVIGRQQLDAQKAESVSEALQYAPGVFGNPFGPDTRFDFFLIRGFTTSDTGLYRDGLQLLNYGFGSFKVEQFGLERVEVLRGPAAVLFGQGSPGGVVNLVTKHPTLEPFGYIEAGGGSFGQKYLAFDLGGPADADGHLFYRLTAIGRNGGTQVDGVEDNVGYIAPAFTWKPDGSTTFTVLSSFQHDETGRINAFLPYYGTVRPQAEGLRIPRSFNTQDNIQNRFRRTQAMVGYEFEHVFDDVWTVRQNARLAFSQTYDNSLGGGIGYLDPTTQTQLSRYRFQAASTQRQFTVDTQAIARFNDGLFGHTFLMGVDYKYFSLNDNQGTFFGVDPFNLAAPNFVSPAGPVTPYLVNFDQFQQTGIYVQDQVKLTPELTLIASGRGDFTTNDIDNKLTPSLSTRQGANAATERFALIYNFDFGLAPYVSYATSFNPQVGTNALSQAFKPTTGEQYEAGVKYEPPGTNIFVTAAFFDLALNNSLTTDPNNVNNSLQLGLTRSRGFEGSITASITPAFNVIASVTNYELKIEKGDNVGRTPVGVPQSFASVFGDYTIPTGEFAGFGFGGGVRYVGHSYANTDNSLKVPERVLFDTLVHYTSGNWRFAINAANIFDKRFVSSCTSINACYYGEARRVTASLSYKW